LADRKVIVTDAFGTVESEVFTGIPQRPVLRPLLWNLLYDELFKKLDNNMAIKAIVFVDNLALTCTIKKD
jgi:hypothetical protein